MLYEVVVYVVMLTPSHLNTLTPYVDGGPSALKTHFT